MIALGVGAPVFAHVGEAADAFGFDDQSGGRVEMLLEERLIVHLFDDGIEAHEFVIIAAVDGEIERSKGGARRGDAAAAVDLIGKRFAKL